MGWSKIPTVRKAEAGRVPVASGKSHPGLPVDLSFVFFFLVCVISMLSLWVLADIGTVEARFLSGKVNSTGGLLSISQGLLMNAV